MSYQALSDIFDKLNSADKDYRFMATSDLLNELNKESMRMDVDTERRVCAVVLQKMQDQAGEISEIAVKCLGALLPKIQDTNVQEILKTLTDSLLNEKKEHEGREMANIGLKTVIQLVPSHSTSGAIVVRGLTHNLAKALDSKNDEIVLMALDIAKPFVAKFGSMFENNDDRLLTVFMSLLGIDRRQVVRKKAISCIGVLSMSLSDQQLDDLFHSMISRLGSDSSKDDSVVAIQIIGTVSLVVGNRIGKHIDQIVPSIFSLIENPTEDDVELLESSVRCLESFVSRCQHFARPHMDSVIDTCLKLLSFDPNYEDDMDDSEEEEMMVHSEDDDEDAYSDDEGYSDDEDDSWKVRKTCAGCLKAVSNSYTDEIEGIYNKVVSTLIRRFSEREENVKVDVLSAYMTLIFHLKKAVRLYGTIDVETLMQPHVPSLMRSIGKQLKHSSPKVQLQAFKVLKETVTLIPEEVINHIRFFVQPITKALRQGLSTTSDLKLEVLSFLKEAMQRSNAATFQSTLPEIAPVVFNSVNERYYKVASEALQTCKEMVHIIRPAIDTIIDDSLSSLIPSLYDAVMCRLDALDVDQEVKESAIRCAADLIAKMGDLFSDKVETVLGILLERMKSDTTRLTSVKALSVIGESALELDLRSEVHQVVVELTVLLKKANVALRQAALRALEVFSGRCGSSFDQSVVQGIIEEAVLLVSDQDLHLAANSLDLMCTLAKELPMSNSEIKSAVLPKAMDLVHSPLLQGYALTSLQRFFASMSDHFDELFQKLFGEVNGQVQQLSTAKCVAALVSRGNPSRLDSTVQVLCKQAKESSSEATRRLAMLCLGEIGRLVSLSEHQSVATLLTSALEDSSEEIKAAASYALGAMTLGNLTDFLPGLVDKIRASQGQQRQLYLLLQSLNEVISSLNESGQPDPISNELVTVLRDMLLSSSEFEEDSRNIAAECIGNLALLHPEIMMPSLKEGINSPSENIRYMIVSGIRHTLVDKPHEVDKYLEGTLSACLACLQDSSRHVRKAAVQLLSAALAHKYRMVQDSLEDILPKLYEQTEKREELIRVLDFGPFKHRIDDGVQLRKSTFECMHLLLDIALTRLNIQEFLQHLRKGLADENDIKLLCYPMLTKLSKIAQSDLINEVGILVDPLSKTLTKNVPKDAVKHERERHQELVQSCLKAIDALSLVDEISTQRNFKHMMDSIVNRGQMKVVFQAIQEERASVEEEQKSSQDQSKLMATLSGGLSNSMSL